MNNPIPDTPLITVYKSGRIFKHVAMSNGDLENIGQMLINTSKSIPLPADTPDEIPSNETPGEDIEIE